METNESILTRSIVGLDERKVLGKMSSLRVDYDTQAVSHYIVMNASTNNAIALPFENAIAVGDTFITVQSYGSFVDANSPASKELVSDSNKLVGVEVYSRTGNTLGTVTAFDFDPVFGAIKSITLDNGSEFKSDAFLFFAPDFVFVDDGSKSAADLRQAEDNTSDAPAAAPASTPATQPAPAAQPAAPAANADGLSNEDALLVDFLIGKTLNDDVANADDTFALPKGTEITREIALDAGGVDLAAGLVLQVLVAADVVGVGVRVVDGGQMPAVGVEDLAHLAPGLLVVAAVDEADVGVVQAHEADLGRALDVVAVSGHLGQFIHGGVLPCQTVCLRMSGSTRAASCASAPGSNGERKPASASRSVQSFSPPCCDRCR